MNSYLNEPCKNDNLIKLNELICSLDEMLNNELKEIEILKSDIVQLLNSGLVDLKKKFLDSYNKKYNGSLKEDNKLLVYTDRNEISYMNEIKF